MDQQQFRELLREVYALSPAGNGELGDGFAFYSNDGVLSVCGESSGSLGFGIMSGLTPTFELLAAVARLNERMTYGHYWLAEGADNSNWSLICGFKFPYANADRQRAGELIYGVLQSHGAMADAARAEIGDVPSRPYVAMPENPEAQAIILMGHLG
ncbi:hypothetical protein SAMN06298212_12718 [Ruaniaceae bacterium KH17]|nr:hypothetical protein SAMN06298212_12718 [Ruaniaceae bacterium KH17]